MKSIRKIIPGKIDEVWCFNPHVYLNLKDFKPGKALLLLYDFYTGKHVFKVAETADAMVTVSEVILDHYKKTSTPKLLLQHGLGKHFADIAAKKLTDKDFKIQQADRIRIGYMGNLLIQGVNRPGIQKIILEHPDKEFHFWGPHSSANNNLGGDASKPDIASFISFLEKQQNVFLRGVKDHATLSKEISIVDAFLLAYDASTELNKASNSHKILEYLSTGKAIISTFVSNYAGSDLLIMADDQNDLPQLFTQVINNLPVYNSVDKQKKRIAFALDNTYPRQVERIHSFLYHDRAN